MTCYKNLARGNLKYELQSDIESRAYQHLLAMSQTPSISNQGSKSKHHSNSEQSPVEQDVFGADVPADSATDHLQQDIEDITKGISKLSTSSPSKSRAIYFHAVPDSKLTGLFDLPPQVLPSTANLKHLPKPNLPSRGSTSRKKPFSEENFLVRSNILLRIFAQRFDLFSTSDTDEIFSYMECGFMRYLGQGPRKPQHQLSTWAVVMTLDKLHTNSDSYDIADVGACLDKAFPSDLFIERFTSSENHEDEVLLIRGVLDQGPPNASKPELPQFLRWLAKVSTFFPSQGGEIYPSGNIDTFWGHSGRKIPSYMRDPVVALPSLRDRLKRPLPDQKLRQAWIATAGHFNSSMRVIRDGKRVPIVACVACRSITLAEDLREAPGKNKCCSACYNRLIDLCHACTEPIHKTYLTAVACGHQYCKECLVHLFKSGTKSLSEFPPKCCGQQLSVYTENYRRLLPKDVTKRYLLLLKARDEAKDVHCATDSCQRTIIKSYAIADEWGFCAECVQMTRVRCFQSEQEHKFNAAENSRVCPKITDNMLFELAASNNWRECPACKSMVSRSEGCNAMLCRCGQRFCYTCGKKNIQQMDCDCLMTFEGGVIPQYHPNPHGRRRNRIIDPELIRSMHVDFNNICRRIGLQCYYARIGKTEAIENLRAVRNELQGRGTTLQNDNELRLWAETTLNSFLRLIYVPSARHPVVYGAIPMAELKRFEAMLNLRLTLPWWTNAQVANLCPHLLIRLNSEAGYHKCSFCPQRSRLAKICVECSSVMCTTCFGEKRAAARAKLISTPWFETPASSTSSTSK